MKGPWKSRSSGITVLSLLFLVSFVSPVSAQYFTIDRFHSDITVHEDASFTVRETIEVKFDRPRHGIYREIPFKYANELGKVIRTPIRVLSAEDGSGRGWKYRASKEGNVVTIRIGDARRYVEGQQTYVITYQVENAILEHFDLLMFWLNLLSV